jgi:Transposase DDE domain
MSQLIAMFCDIDDFCKWFEPLYRRHLLQSGQRQRTRQTALALSEIMTIIVYFHSSHYRDFKHYYTEYVATHLRPYFPALVSYSRFVELMPRVVVPLCGYLHTRKGRCTGITFVDSTSLAVCYIRRISRHKVFAGYATRGKSSMGWFFGFKLHLMVNDEGELVAFRVTTGEVNDQVPVGRMARGLWGQLFGDRGYISRALHKMLWAQGLALITLIRRNMKPRLLRLWDRLLLRKRFLIETINDQLKNISQIEHSRHRSLTGFMVNLVAGLLAYTYQPKKPSLGLRVWDESRLPVCGE